MDQLTGNALALIGPVKPKPARAASDSPLPLDAPAMNTSDEPITLDLTAFETMIEPPRSETVDAGDAASSAPVPPAARPKSFAPLAASLALATLVGAAGGAATTYGLSGTATVSPQVVAAISDETRVLQGQVASLANEMKAFNAGLESASRTAAGQYGRIAERLDRAEKAQAEPVAKIAKLTEGLDRVERRMAWATSSDVTGSVTTVEKQQAKPAVVEGWRLLDFYAGRAVLASRDGTLFDVGPGANLPGIGRIETIKRVDGKVVVTTPKGIIVSELQQQPQRRPAPYFLPRGY